MAKTITPRRLIDSATMTPRGMRRADLEGEILPADPGRELIPWEEREVMAQRNPERFTPIINVSFPRIRADEESLPGSMTWEKRTLQREPTVESDFLLPVLQAFGMAWAALVLSGLLAWAMSWPWKFPAITFGVVLAVTLLARIRLMDSLLWATETLTGHDLNSDGKVGNPQTVTLANPAMARQAAAHDVATVESEAAKAELLAFLHRCYVTGTAEAAHGVKAGGPDRTQYLKQRDALMALGIATWKNPARPKAGWKLAVSYQRAIELVGKHVL